MNDLYEPFDSQEFRQAMNYAIDSEAIVEEVLNGRGTAEGQPAPPSWPGYNPDVDPYPHDPEEATRLVEESGYTGEMELELKAAFGRVSKGRETALAVANQITESVPNVTCTVNEMSEAALDDIKRGSGPEDQEGRGDFFMNNTGGSPAHAARGKVNSYIYSGGHSNTFSDSEIDALFEEAVSAPRDELDEIGHEMMELVHEKAPWLFLFIRGGAWGISNEIDLAPSANESMEPYEIHPYDGN
jgi:peptide/nickel transport system substrate-binding protein